MLKKRYPPLELTASQHKTLSSIFDTFISELTPTEEQEIVNKFKGKEDIYGIKLSQVNDIAPISASSLNIKNIVFDYFENFVEPGKIRMLLIRALDTLATRPGSLLMTGHWEPFHEMSKEKREKVLQSWRKSSFKPLYTLFNTFSSLCLFNAYNRTQSPLIEALGNDSAKFFENHPDYQPVEHDRIPMMTKDQITGMAFDAIVVGSGAGGGVVAAELAQAGYSVLVIEKGKYYHQSEIVQEEEVCYQNMYDGGTSSTSTNGSIQCLSGSTLGGGTALNYLASLKPQYFVREEWAKLGLSHFISPQFSKDLERVFERIGATTENVMLTKTAEKFKQGCEYLGYSIEKVAVNTGGKAHHCSRCMMGCKAGIKNSTANTWLIDAKENGARFLDRSRVTRVLIKDGEAVGVECYIHDSQQITPIMAKRVIVSCGSLRTPNVLRNSGLSNSNIGKNLVLQPICLTYAFYNEPIRQLEGPLITSVCNDSDNCQGDNYGAKIEEASLMMGTLANKLPWLGSAKHKELMLKHKSMLSLLNVARDKDSIGEVEYDESSQKILFNYKLSKHDEKSLAMSIEKSMKIFVASGARELYTPQSTVEGFEFKEDEESRIDNPRFIEWLETVKKAGMFNTPLMSVHQIGSCRMGVTPKTSVVKPSGETWEVKKIYIADASLFPTAVGVNPMVTIEALALHVARNVISSFDPKARL